MTGQGEGGAVLGEEARRAVEHALMDNREEWLTVTQHGTVRNYVAAAELALDSLRPVVAALTAQARADGKAAAEFGPLGDNHHNAAACPHCSRTRDTDLAQARADGAADRERIKRVQALCARMQQNLPYGGVVYPKDANVRVSDIRAALRSES